MRHVDHDGVEAEVHGQLAVVVVLAVVDVDGDIGFGARGEDGDPRDEVVRCGVQGPGEDLDDGGGGGGLGGLYGGEDGFDGVAVHGGDGVVGGGGGVEDLFGLVGREGWHGCVLWRVVEMGEERYKDR